MIAPAEFAAALARCLPALARVRIAVANSAGPDSTALLLLLAQLLPPGALLSLHVDHALQPASPSMAALAAANAARLRVAHRTLRVPWGHPPFPPAPPAGPLERVARDARYSLLFRAMARDRIALVALGHHADDQLETAVMRLARGSSPLGAAGMRPVRRWGMGAPRPLASFGHPGLGAFVLRPLLSFSKDRMVATCRAHQLRYATDTSNFQPSLTARNAIRHRLQNQSLPDTIAQFLESIASDSLDKEQRLRDAVSRLAARAQRVDRQVTSHLATSLLPSPTGTICLSSAKLRDITDPDVRIALVLRVLRYVSFHPWGSPHADAHRRHTSLRRIVAALWEDPRATKFTAGAGVLWTPLNRSLHSTDWLASRAPPFSKNPQQHGAGSPARLVMDLTDQIRDAISSDVTLRILYDCRFLLCIRPDQMPAHVRAALDKSLIKVLPFTQYYWPKVVLQRESHPDQVLAAPHETGTRDDPWISIQWIRPLDAV